MLRRAQILPSTRQVRPHPGSHLSNSTVLHPAPLFLPIFLVHLFPVFRRPTVGVTTRLEPPRPVGVVYRRRPRSRPRSRQSVSTTTVRNDDVFPSSPRQGTTTSTRTSQRRSSDDDDDAFGFYPLRRRRDSFASISVARTKCMNEWIFSIFSFVQKNSSQQRQQQSVPLRLFLTNHDPWKEGGRPSFVEFTYAYTVIT